MSDYQAIYDAVRSRIVNGNVGEVVREVAWQHFDISGVVATLSQQVCVAISDVRYEHTRPSAVFRPHLSLDGYKWMALYGDNLMEGVAGFGDTPAEAMAEFDKAWTAAIETPSRSKP